MGVAYILDLQEFLALESIQAKKDDFLNYVHQRPFWAPVIYMGTYILVIALSLPVGTLMTLLGGFLFGLFKGTLFVVTAATLGSTVIFIIAQTSFGNSLRKRAGRLYQKIEKNMKENAVGYLLFMRLIPIFPFFLVNVVPALFNVPLRIFVLTTFFGIIPGTLAFVYFGQQLGQLETVSDLLSPQMLLAFGVLGMFAITPSLYKQMKARRKNTAPVKEIS